MVLSQFNLTKNEMCTLHRGFEHTTAIKLLNLLYLVGHHDRSHHRLPETVNSNCSKYQNQAVAAI